MRQSLDFDIHGWFQNYHGGKYPKGCCYANTLAECLYGGTYKYSDIVVGALGYKVKGGICLQYGV